MLGKTARKVSFTPFCVPQMLFKTRTWEQCPQMLAGKAREKMTYRLLFPVIYVTPSVGQ